MWQISGFALQSTFVCDGFVRANSIENGKRIALKLLFFTKSSIELSDCDQSPCGANVSFSKPNQLTPFSTNGAPIIRLNLSDLMIYYSITIDVYIAICSTPHQLIGASSLSGDFYRK
jgi:hypothetical protein